MMRLKKSLSLVTRLLCIFALIGLNFAHNFNSRAFSGLNSSSHFQHTAGSGFNHWRLVLVTDICSKESQSSDPGKLTKQNHDNSPCHENGPCHACRIGSSMLTPPDAGEIGQGAFVELAMFLTYEIANPASYLLNSNTSPRSPPRHMVV